MADHQLKPVKFYFDTYPEQYFDGYRAGGMWNGFDNVCVTQEVAAAIDAFFAAMCAPDGLKNKDDPIVDMPVGKDGLIDLSNGYATVIVRDGVQ